MTRRVIENSVAAALFVLITLVLTFFASPLIAGLTLGILGIPTVLILDRLFTKLEQRRDTMGTTPD